MDNELSVGARLRTLRRELNLSQKDLAERCGLSLNAVSLIERDEISPNVATLQKLASALNVKMSYFFETDRQATVIHVKGGQRPAITNRGVTIEGIGMRLEKQQMEPFLMTLAPHSNIGSGRVTHTGHELVCCVSGNIQYEIDETTYLLEPGDMLMFEASLPHSSRNPGDKEAQFLLVLQTPDRPQDSVRWHFIDQPGAAHMG
jgi:transcriptional regulator with XRE-family HTH domain